jgi:hypothetical protein
MKKLDINIMKLLQERRERKEFKRRRKALKYKGASSSYLKQLNFWAEVDWQIIRVTEFPLYNFFKECEFIDGEESLSTKITLPEKFSLTENFNESIQKIKDFFASTYLIQSETITLDFTNCAICDQAAVFVTQIMKLDLREFFDKLDSKLRVRKRNLKFEIIESKVERVNKLLFIGGILNKASISDNEDMHPVTTLGYHRGSKTQKHYLENKKGIITTNIVKYLNECLLDHETEITAKGINQLEGLVGEILNNAEDHSPFITYYATGNFQQEKSPTSKENVVGEVNLSIMNFGFSIFEGFEQTKVQNAEMYRQMEQLYEKVSSTPFFKFTKENMFTLYALQDGISRLNFKDASRGTGTMKFINSFFYFGDYEDRNKQYIPSLTIFSGKTELTCDNKFRPVFKDGTYLLSLNEKQDLTEPPKSSNLRSLKFPFPGTLLSITLYLNKGHIHNKIASHGHNKKY